jgi:hypothetical protein
MFSYAYIYQNYSPLAPTIMVRGKQKAITCSSSLGEKERTPLMDSLDIDAMVDYLLTIFVLLAIDGRCHKIYYRRP